MAVNSRDVKAVVHDRHFFMEFDFFSVIKESRRNNLPVIRSSVNGEHDGTNVGSVHHSIRKLHPF